MPRPRKAQGDRDFLRGLRQGKGPAELLANLLRSARELVAAAQAGAVLLYDETTGSFRLVAAEGLEFASLHRISIPQDRLRQSQLPLDRPAIVHVHPAEIQTLLGEELARAIASPEPVAILWAPVTDGATPVGALLLFGRGAPEGFTEADVQRLEAAAEELSLAMLAARSQARLGECETLLQVLLTRLPEPVLIANPDGTILEANPAAAQAMGHRLDELRGMNLVQLLPSATAKDILRLLEKGGVPAREEEEEGEQGGYRRGEWGAVAVEYRGSPALLVVGRGIGPRSERASPTASLEALARAGPAIARSRTPREAVEQIVTTALEITGADYANVLLFTPERKTVETFEPRGAPKIPVQIRKSGFSHWILDTEQVLVIDDIGPDGETTPPLQGPEGPIRASRILVQEGIRSLVGLPLVVGGSCRAILYVHSRRPASLRPHVPVLSLLAAHAGVALENAVLYEELDRSACRYRALFEQSPVALWSADLSAVKARLDALRREGVQDLGAVLTAKLELGQELWNLVQVKEVSRAALDLAEATDAEDLSRYLKENLSESGWSLWKQALVALWEGRPTVEGTITFQTLQGRERHVHLVGQVLPGHEAQLDQVLISAVDLTSRVKAEQDLARRDAILRAATFAAEQLLREPSLDQVIPRVLAELGEAAGVSRAYLFEERVDAQGRPLVSQRYEWVAPGISPQIDNPLLQNLPYAHAGYARWAEAFARGEPVYGIVREFPPEEQPLLLDQDIRAIAVVPIRVRGRRWGFLGFDDCVHDRNWSRGEVEALRVAAETLGAAIERAELEHELHRRREELAALFRVSASLGTTLDLPELLARLFRELRALLPWEAGFLALVDRPQESFQLIYGLERDQQLPPMSWPLDPQGSLSGWVASTRRPLLIGDLPAEGDRLPAAARAIGLPTRSWLGVPLVADDEVVGVLSVQACAPNVYEPRHLELLEALAGPVAMAVRNAELFAGRVRLEHKLRELERASREMKLASDREALYGITLDLIRDVLGYAPCAVLIPEGDELVVVAEHGELSWARGMRLPLDGPGVTVAAFRSRETVYVPDVRQDPRYVPSHPETKSELALPLVVGQQALGVLDVNSPRVEGIPPEDRDLLAIVASELAVALAGLAHLQRREALSGKLDRLHTASRALSRATTAEEVGQGAVRALVELLGFEHANIGLVRGDLLVPVAGAGSISGSARPLRKGEGIAGRVWETGESLWGNIEDFPEARPVSPEIRSFLAVPIGRRGVIQAVSTHRDAFTWEDVRLAEILALHVEEELRRVELEGELREQAIRDPLTGLYNRRFLTEVLGREIARATRYGHPLTLVLVDVDHFKAVNDRYGHVVGDAVLRRVGEVLRENVRAGDYAFRYGGEEFVVLLPETRNGGEEVVRRLQDRLSAITLPDVPELQVSASLGHVVWEPAEGRTTLEDLLRRADAVLYEIKRARGGR